MRVGIKTRPNEGSEEDRRLQEAEWLTASNQIEIEIPSAKTSGLKDKISSSVSSDVLLFHVIAD